MPTAILHNSRPKEGTYMRGERREGRFSVMHEQQAIKGAITTELVRTVGTTIDWWFYDQVNTVVDPIYDVGSYSAAGGRRWTGPIVVPVVNASIFQGTTPSNDERGFYNVDTLRITINVDVVRQGNNLVGSNSGTIPQLSMLEINPDHYLLDRIVFREQVYQPIKINTLGFITDRYTVISIDCTQVNPEELVNDPQFQSYANFQFYNPLDGYGAKAYGAETYGI